tara:strand:+ start:509 stop:1078 length:570 start_codon:yes stop_codon:yes gene_type:complete
MINNIIYSIKFKYNGLNLFQNYFKLFIIVQGIIFQIKNISHLKSQIFKILVLIACIFTKSSFFSQYLSDNSPKEDFWIYTNTAGIYVDDFSDIRQDNVKAATIRFKGDLNLDLLKSDLIELKNTDELWDYLKLNNFRHVGHTCPDNQQKNKIKNWYFSVDTSIYGDTQLWLYIPSNLNFEWLKPISKSF